MGLFSAGNLSPQKGKLKVKEKQTDVSTDTFSRSC